MGVFLLSTEATPRGHLEWKLTPKTPCGHHVHGRHGHVSPVKSRWRFSKFRKKYETLTLTLKICTFSLFSKNGFKELTLVLFGSLFYGIHIVFYSIFGQTINWSTAKPQTSPKRKKKTFKWPWKISFVNKFTGSFVCLPEDVWPSNFGKCLKMPQR